MKFLETILNNSTVKEAKLYTAAKKASNKPDTGVVIQTPSAYHVIKDCAKIAHMYLPIYIFGQYQNPFEALKGKFSKSDIEEFITSANSNFVNHQLLHLILEKIKKNITVEETPKTSPILEPTTEDPYGDYGYASTEPVIQSNINSDVSVVEILCQAFSVIK
jgi:hypothetical protein